MPASSSSRDSHRRSRTTVVVLLLTVAALLAACTGSPGSGTAPEPDVGRATPLKKVDLSGVQVARGPFCDLVDDHATKRALGGQVLETHHYGNGDKAEIIPGFRDVSHEFNCTFEGQSPAQARAWLYVRPVQTKEARRLVRQAKSEPRCSKRPSLKFGAPTVTVLCRKKKPERSIAVGLHGLFGDTWLSCQVTVDRSKSQPLARQRDAALHRTQRWCVDLVSLIETRS